MATKKGAFGTLIALLIAVGLAAALVLGIGYLDRTVERYTAEGLQAYFAQDGSSIRYERLQARSVRGEVRGIRPEVQMGTTDSVIRAAELVVTVPARELVRLRSVALSHVAFALDAVVFETAELEGRVRTLHGRIEGPFPVAEALRVGIGTLLAEAAVFEVSMVDGTLIARPAGAAGGLLFGGASGLSAAPGVSTVPMVPQQGLPAVKAPGPAGPSSGKPQSAGSAGIAGGAGSAQRTQSDIPDFGTSFGADGRAAVDVRLMEMRVRQLEDRHQMETFVVEAPWARLEGSGWYMQPVEGRLPRMDLSITVRELAAPFRQSLQFPMGLMGAQIPAGGPFALSVQVDEWGIPSVSIR